MNLNELFINSKQLPETLNNDEFKALFIQMKSGNIEARNKLIEHNIRLVLKVVTNKYNRIKYDKKELVCVGVMGLIRAVDTFDIDKNFQFSTYAGKCICYEINNKLLYYLSKDTILDSMEKIIHVHSNGDDVKLKDFLADDNDIEEQYIEKETLILINDIISELPDDKRKMIEMYYCIGEYKDKEFTQREIAEQLGINRSTMAHIMRDTLNDIKYQLKTRRINHNQKVKAM